MVVVVMVRPVVVSVDNVVIREVATQTNATVPQPLLLSV